MIFAVSYELLKLSKEAALVRSKLRRLIRRIDDRGG